MLKGFVSGEEKDIKRIPMKGKNLFDVPTVEKGRIDNGEVGYASQTSSLTIEGGTVSFTATATYRGVCSGFFEIPETGNLWFDFTTDKTLGVKFVFYDSSKTWLNADYIHTLIDPFPAMATIPTGAKYVRISFTGQITGGSDYTMSDIMLNTGTQPLPYEPCGYQEGWEVRDNQDRLIWGREDELQTATGTLPFKGYSLPVKVKSLLGNAVQNGTPSPQNIVTPEMCGVRTAQLFEDKIVNCSIDANGRLISNSDFDMYIAKVEQGVAYKASTAITGGFYTTKPIIGSVSYNGQRMAFAPSAVTAPITGYMTFRVNSGSDEPMLNLGSTAFPYEPYGWKVPFENHGENLFDASLLVNNMHLDITTGLPIAYTGRIASPDPVDVSQYSTVTISYVTAATTTNAMYSIFSNNELVGRFTAVSSGTVIDVSNADKMYICFYSTWGGNVDTSSVSNIMLNLGSTPKPYSPYLNAIIPVYLGEVPTVRRIKKMVLDGTEDTWGQTEAINSGFYFDMTGYLRQRGVIIVICSHYVSQGNINGAAEMQDGKISFYANATQPSSRFYIKDSNFANLADFKSYLSAQYANGTPVTIWYVLANDQIGISNEPLCKISTYADELTTIQVHGLSAPLYGIGDYKDTLNLSTGVVTRKIKRLVLDGTEGWYKNGNTYLIRLGTIKSLSPSIGLISTHYPPEGTVANVRQYTSTYWSSTPTPVIGIRDESYTSTADFKAFLAAQYANGTPVTVWYILANEETETVTVPTGMTGEIEGYLTQVSTPTPTNRSVPKWNGVEETGGTYAVTVYTPPEIPTTTGQNTLTVETNLAPSKLEVSIHAKKIHYGFKIDKSNDDSESAVIYTHDAVTMTPAYMDFTNDRFDYGSWGNAFFVRDCYPVALNLDGTEAYRLDPDDYTKKTDGTPSDIFYELLTEEPSDWSTQWKQYYTKSGDEYVLNSQSTAPTFATDTYYKLTYSSSFTGNFMMAFPKVWFYRHEDSQYNYIEISNHRLSDDWKCYAHINTSGQEVDFIYLPLFKGVIKDSKLRSLPGQIPQGGTTATIEVNAATALGSRWQIWDHSSVECLNDLLTLMSKSIDSQGRYGAGRSNAYNASDTVTYGKLQSGTLIKKGKFHGYSSGYKDVKVFGIESLWANRYDRIQGLLLANGVWKVKMTPPYNFTGTDFVTLSSASVPADVGYLSRVQTSEYGSIPAATISTSGKYFKDYFYKYANDTCVPLRGGNCGDTDIAGYRFIYAGDPAWRTAWSFGASPVYK